MATVHLGRLSGPVDPARIVAIKRLHPRFADNAEFLAMFIDEARITARLGHPNVVATLDVQLVASELFIVMEYVHGTSLARLLQFAREVGRPVPLPIVSAIMSNVLHGLHSAHEARGDEGELLEVVHRDVTPHNILVGVDGVARVADFGVAKALGRSQSTRVGHVKGKLAYMAPEQLRGQSLTRRCDVYGASVVLWEMLALRPLYAGDTDASVMEQVLLNFIDPPSKFFPSVPDEVDAIALKGLDGSPARRFATALEMAGALERLIPKASPHEVGSWVATTARADVEDRTRQLDDIDGGRAEIEPVTIPTGTTLVSLTEADLSATVSTNLATTRKAPRRVGPLVWGAALFTLLLGLGLGLSFDWPKSRAKSESEALTVRTTSRSPSPSPLPSSSGAAGPLPAQRASVQSPSSVLQSVQSPPVPSPSDQSTLVQPSVEEPRPSLPESLTVPTRQQRAAAAELANPGSPETKRSRPKVKNPCKPPYTVDSAGTVTFKRGCL
jgi:serine/threonine-protein kinase